MADWDPALYARFADERVRPIHDLIAAIPLASPRWIVDLGCGSGASTARLAIRWPDAEIEGLDRSKAMLTDAREKLPRIRFLEGDFVDYAPERPPDLVFANAALQWAPDHQALIPNLFAQVASGGAFAFQVPDNLDEPSHLAMRETAAEGPWADRLAGADAARAVIPSAEAYYDWLSPLATKVWVWRTVYRHDLENVEAIGALFASTGLKPYLDPLDPPMAAAFRAAYLERLRAAYPIRADGRVLLRFPRLFLVAMRP